MNNDEAPIEAGAAGAPEGTPAVEPTTDDVAKMYDELGIKAPVPTGKTKGRPKTPDSGDKKASKQDDASGKPEKGRKTDDGEDKPKAASASDSDGVDGDDADAKGKKVSSKDGKDGKEDPKVSGDGDEDADGVQKSKSEDNKEAAKPGEGDAEQGADGAGQKPDESDDSKEKGEDDEKGKRPGKSNPEVEKRMQKLTAEIKARDELIEKQSKELEESQKKQFESRSAQEDPEYKIEDFKKVRDEEGNILELNDEQAELAYRRWKDGYDQRKTEREAKFNHEQSIQRYQQEAADRLIKSSVEAYDTLVDIYQNTPELDAKSDKFDQEFSDLVMPIIEEAVIYQKGTEPTKENREKGVKPVIVGLKMHPGKILDAMNKIRQSKRSLPLNGTQDTVESSSGVRVNHERSSDPTAKAANDLYKDLGIDKRL